MVKHKTPFTTLEWRGLRGWIDTDRIIYHRFHRRQTPLGKAQLSSHRRFLQKVLFDECYNMTCCAIIMRMSKDRLAGHFPDQANTNSYWGERRKWARERYEYLNKLYEDFDLYPNGKGLHVQNSSPTQWFLFYNHEYKGSLERIYCDRSGYRKKVLSYVLRLAGSKWDSWDSEKGLIQTGPKLELDGSIGLDEAKKQLINFYNDRSNNT